MQRAIAQPILLTLAILSTLWGTAAMGQYEEGVDYVRVSPPLQTSSESIEIVEFFWYGSVHCLSFEQQSLAPWKESLPSDVEMTRSPAVWNPSMETHARAYFSAVALGVAESLHGPLYEEIVVNRSTLDDETSLADFFADYGVARDEFLRVFNSFAVASAVREADTTARAARIQGVPELLIAGQYRISTRRAGGQEEMLRVAEHVISLARQERGMPEPQSDAFLIDDDSAHWNADVGLMNGGLIPASAAQLFRVYFGALGRRPDNGGFIWWSTEIAEGRHDLRSMAAGFIFSDEFQALADSNDDGVVSDAEFIDHMYRNVFGREPDADGFAWWLSELTSGRRTQTDALVEMTQSNEYVELTIDALATYLPEGGVTPPDAGSAQAGAEAGPAQTVVSGESVVLDGSDSSGGSGDISSYTWRQLEGAPVQLLSSGATIASFVAPVVNAAETLVFELTISLPDGTRLSDTAAIVVNPRADTGTAKAATVMVTEFSSRAKAWAASLPPNVDRESPTTYMEVRDFLPDYMNLNTFARGVLGQYADASAVAGMSPAERDQLAVQIDRLGEVMHHGVARAYGMVHMDAFEAGGPNFDSSFTDDYTEGQQAFLIRETLNVFPDNDGYVIDYAVTHLPGGEWTISNLIMETVNLGQVFRSRFEVDIRAANSDVASVVTAWACREGLEFEAGACAEDGNPVGTQRTQELYNKSCAVCHAAGVAGAPVTGDASAWEPRLNKGIDQLLLSVKTGLNVMPPGGMCFDCTDDDYPALIRYMSGLPDSSDLAANLNPIVRVAPVYPRRAQTRGITGFCIVDFTVTEGGTVTDVQPIDCEPSGVFERASVKAAEKFRYSPPVVDGIAVSVHGVRQRFDFTIDG